MRKSNIIRLIVKSRTKNFMLGLLLFFTNAPAQNFWQQTSGPYGGTIWSLAIDSSGHIFAATFRDGGFRSTDKGDTWTSLNSGLENAFAGSFAIDASGYLFAGTIGDGVFRSVQPSACVPIAYGQTLNDTISLAGERRLYPNGQRSRQR